MKLRSHLITLVAAAVFPLFIFALVMVVLFGREQRRAVEEGLADTARALSLAIDRELLASIRTLEALATSEHLDSGELRKFYEQAKRVRAAHGEWETILLVDPSGQQLINLRQPFGSPLPRSGALYLIKQVSDTGRPAVSNLFWGHIAQRHLFGVDVPVIRDGRVRYVLTASTSPVSLVKLLEKQKIPPDRFATLIDRNKIIIARTRDFEQFLGKPAAPLSAAKTSEEQEGFRRGVTHDGRDVYAAFRKSDLSGWSVGLAVPVAVAEAHARRSLTMLIVGGSVLLVGAVLLATVFGRRIAKAVTALSGSAAALGRGETPHSVASAITEVNQVAQAIEDAAVSRKRLEREVAEIREKEQQRIGQDLHDGLGQELTGIAFLAKGLEEKLSRKSIPEGADAGKIAVLVAQAVSQTRNLARGLSPVPVEGNSLMSALEELAASASSLFGVACRFRCDPPVLLQDNAVATHLYRIAQEAVDNAVKHGQPSQVLISLAQAGGTITLAVADDGRGLQGEPQNVEGMGLRIMRYRAEVIGAMLDIQPRPQGGVVVTCSIPNP